MINEYYITESAIIKRVYSVKAHSVEEAKDIEDLAEDLGLQIIADQLRENREDQERRENE